jgi:hypothetical protein
LYELTSGYYWKLKYLVGVHLSGGYPAPIEKIWIELSVFIKPI